MINIVIPSYTNSAGLRTCLESVVKYTDLGKAIVTVVANGALQETRDVCKDFPVSLLWFDEPLGFSRACNAGIQAVNAPFTVLLNDDCILLEQTKNEWLEILNAPFVDEKVGITGVLKNYCPSAQRDFLLFFCVMIRREVIDDIGLLDQAFTVGAGEDTDFCIKAEDAGWLIKQTPETTPYIVDRPDAADLPDYQKQMWITEFPLYHNPGTTVGKISGFNEIFERNSQILKERYAVNISRAQKIEGWMADSELQWLAQRAKKASVFVEIGSWCGRSSRAIADNLPVDALCICVDTFNGSSGEPDAHITAKEREGDAVYMKFQANLYDHIRLGRVMPLRMESGNAAEFLQQMGVQPDVIFIDGDHSTEGFRRDVNLWQPLLKEGGLLCGHDYYLPEQNPLAWIGVRTVVNEMFPDAQQVPNTSIWHVRPTPESAWDSLRRTIPVSEPFGEYGGFFCTENQNNSLPA